MRTTSLRAPKWVLTALLASALLALGCKTQQEEESGDFPSDTGGTQTSTTEGSMSTDMGVMSTDRGVDMSTSEDSGGFPP